MSNDKQNETASGRRQFSPEQKIKILREHLPDKVPIWQTSHVLFFLAISSLILRL